MVKILLILAAAGVPLAAQIFPAEEKLEKLYEGGHLTEGAAVAPDGTVYFSDVTFTTETRMQAGHIVVPVNSIRHIDIRFACCSERFANRSEEQANVYSAIQIEFTRTTINFAVLRRSHSSLHKQRNSDVKIIADQQGHGMRTHLDNYVQSGVAERKAEASKLYADFIGVLRKRG